MQLPNGVSLVLGVALVAALTAIAGALPGQFPDWTGLALAAVIGGIAKAIQVWLDSQQPVPDIVVTQDGKSIPYDDLVLEQYPAWRRWLVG